MSNDRICQRTLHNTLWHPKLLSTPYDLSLAYTCRPQCINPLLLVTPYNDGHIGPQRLRWWLVAWRKQAIIWTNAVSRWLASILMHIKRSRPADKTDLSVYYFHLCVWQGNKLKAFFVAFSTLRTQNPCWLIAISFNFPLGYLSSALPHHIFLMKI